MDFVTRVISSRSGFGALVALKIAVLGKILDFIDNIQTNSLPSWEWPGYCHNRGGEFLSFLPGFLGKTAIK